jgi:hypothetical protein
MRDILLCTQLSSIPVSIPGWCDTVAGVTALPRRRFLTLTGVAAAALTGCQVSDPRIVGGPTVPPPEPAPTPTPDIPGRQASLAHEVELAALCEQLQHHGTSLGLPSPQLAVAGWMAEAHAVHVTALLARRPEQHPTGPPTPERDWTPWPRPSPTAELPAGSRDRALRAILDGLEDAVADHRRNALGSSGSAALLWGSLATYAGSAAAALTANTVRPAPPAAPIRPVAPRSDTEAAQQTVRQVHALVYGYQVAIPWFRGAEFESAYDVLVRRRGLRDRLTRRLREAGMVAPAAEPAYGLPVQPHDRATATELLWRMETAFAPFAGGWLAAATDDDVRGIALQSLEEATTLGIRWGGPLVVWPGWPG